MIDCIWCDNPINGAFVSTGGNIMHEDCHEDYLREIREVQEVKDDWVNMVDPEYVFKFPESAQKFVDSYALAKNE